MLLPEVADNLCFTCHEELGERLAVDQTHEPAADGDCLGCHSPHWSEQKELLTASIPGLCLDCHDGEDEDFLALHLDQAGESLNCVGCHDAHASATGGLLQSNQHDPFVGRACEVCHPGSDATGGGQK